MKIISRYILKEHIAPFIFAFFIITFLLVIDFVPKIVDRVIDKDLELLVVLELLALNLAWMLALSIPMSVLVATLMAFGRLSSDFEVTAIKASGINLIHVLIPLLVAASLVTIGMVQFNDYILPDLNKKARSLLGDIQAMRPTLIFQSGIFISDIPGYLVLIDEVDHATSYVKGVRITEIKNPNRPRLIIARDGYLEMADDGRTMRFTLYNGEIHSLDLEEPDNYRKLNFENQIINVSASSTELVRTESDYRTDREMNIDQMHENVERALNAAAPLRAKMVETLNDKFRYLFADSFVTVLPDTISDSAALKLVRSDITGVVRQAERSRQQLKAHNRIRNKYQIEIYKKYSIPAASLAFILVGAPLGIITRRGGMGVAIAVSILLFMLYWAFLIGGEDIADRGLVSPFWAMWSANILISSVGIYLIYIVLTERPVFAWFRKSGQ